MGLDGLFVAAHQLHEVNALGQISDVVVVSFSGYKGFNSFTQQVEHNNFPDRIGLVSDGDIIGSGIRENGGFRLLGILGTKHQSGYKEEKNE